MAVSLRWSNLRSFKIKYSQKNAAHAGVIYSGKMLAQDVRSARLFPIRNGIADVGARPQKE